MSQENCGGIDWAAALESAARAGFEISIRHALREQIGVLLWRADVGEVEGLGPTLRTASEAAIAKVLSIEPGEE